MDKILATNFARSKTLFKASTLSLCYLQAQDYRVQYDSIVRIFLLPKSHTPHTLVVISLDPPIRKGQTFYPHILVQLPTEEDISINLEIDDEQFNEKNEKVFQ